MTFESSCHSGAGSCCTMIALSVLQFCNRFLNAVVVAFVALQSVSCCCCCCCSPVVDLYVAVAVADDVVAL